MGREAESGDTLSWGLAVGLMMSAGGSGPPTPCHPMPPHPALFSGHKDRAAVRLLEALG